MSVQSVKPNPVEFIFGQEKSTDLLKVCAFGSYVRRNAALLTEQWHNYCLPSVGLGELAILRGSLVAVLFGDVACDGLGQVAKVYAEDAFEGGHRFA